MPTAAPISSNSAPESAVPSLASCGLLETPPDSEPAASPALAPRRHLLRVFVRGNDPRMGRNDTHQTRRDEGTHAKQTGPRVRPVASPGLQNHCRQNYRTISRGVAMTGAATSKSFKSKVSRWKSLRANEHPRSAGFGIRATPTSAMMSVHAPLWTTPEACGKRWKCLHFCLHPPLFQSRMALEGR